MCNASNHSPGCTCGWGGGGHAGRSSGGWHNSGGHHSASNYFCFTANGYRWKHYQDDYCRPTSCPVCGASVFFVRHNGGSVWFDSLGKPWPKHPCLDTSYSSSRHYTVGYGWDSTFGVHERLLHYSANLAFPVLAVVIEAVVLGEGNNLRLNLRCEDGKFLTVYISAQTNVGKIIGEIVLFSKPDKKFVFVNLTHEYALQIEPVIPFVVGETYAHDVYGIGEMISVQRVGDNFGVEIEFRTGGYRKMLISTTDLKPLQKPKRVGRYF